MRKTNFFHKHKKKKHIYAYEEQIRKNAKASQEELLNEFKIASYGLSEKEVQDRQAKYGKNEVKEKKFPWGWEFLKSYFSPFNIILLLITTYSLYSYFSEDEPSIFDLVAACIVGGMILLSGTFTYIQTIRGNLIAKKLTKFISKKTIVIREPYLTTNEINRNNEFEFIKYGTEMSANELVPGDLIHLATGDVIPADVRVILSNNLLINQSSLTGESLPVQKQDLYQETNNFIDFENICLMGTTVVSGNALGVVVATGENTYFSSISETISERRPQTSFAKGIKKVTFLLIIFMLVMVPIVLVLNGLTKNDWTTSLVFAISIAVGLTPEMLPMIVTSNLARGSKKLSQQKIITKNLSAIQNLGAIDVLCTDKTGTITNDNIELVDYRTLDNKNNEHLLKLLYLNAFYQTGIRNPLDSAITNYIDKNNLTITTNAYQKIHEIPFDFHRRRLTIIVKTAYDESIVISKGAVEEILSTCKYVEYQGKIVPLDDSMMRQIKSTVDDQNSQGLRVLGLAYKNLQAKTDDFIDSAEGELIFCGFASFLDTPKASAAGMIKSLAHYGVDLKILTGDNEQVTRAICKRINLKIKGVISGSEIEKMTPEQLAKIVEKNNIFVKLTPIQKVEVIKALKMNNHVVGYMGDGINDAPVLRQSDVAISVDNATDIVKEASDLILLEKSLNVIEEGIVEGRKVFGNILKYIKITIASQFGNVFSVLVASAWLPFTPMMPVQLLFQNLLYDISQFAIAFDRVDSSFLAKPQRWTTKDFLPFALINGPVSSIFDIVTFAVLYIGYDVKNHVDDPSAIAMFNAGWFIEGLLTQILVVQMFRTEKIPFIQSRSPWPVNVMTGLLCAIGFTIPFTVLGANMSMVSPPYSFIGIVIAIIISYCLLSQLVKMGYIKIFKKWL
ncbi:magnesium-translocating P-type ATPase [Spiroplasma chrysopicola]|uniref:Magnesium-transporting ATPase, P-type 1 n=1 Tax=Spiroplasma chrysopicola DF-1 TaxID=1276227 RepID=R4UGQ4_9MOLU|nr:magnesium-translocating P-type ATPase [Spiroplasma chrysopicola]AGM25320.1 Mg(2+) transport ATPase, P-type [Spiroplasma chrysopicola DF-1]